MSHRVTAIYENGILRPLAPLDLPEQAQVEITVDKTTSINQPQPTHRQAVRAALRQTEMERQAGHTPPVALTDEERERYARLFAADTPLSDYIREERDAR